MNTGVIINIKGGFHVGKDGLVHTEECCKIGPSGSWSRKDKGFDDPMEFISVHNWPLPVIPRIGESIKLPTDDPYGQEVTVKDVIYGVPDPYWKTMGVDVWVGGWTHWKADSIRDLFRRAYALIGSQYIETGEHR